MIQAPMAEEITAEMDYEDRIPLLKRRTAKSMIDGLQYHFSNYSVLMDSLPPINNEDPSARIEIMKKMKLEVIAYLNQLGRFYFFVRSENQLDLIPTIARIYPVRSKYAAHRSADYRHGETDEEVFYHLMANDIGSVSKNGDLEIQIQIPTGYVLFRLGESHGEILNEANNALGIILDLSEGTRPSSPA